MFKTSHLQELKRRYREMYASPEEGTDELVDQYKKETPGQSEGIEEDTDKDKPGTQGDQAEYQRKRKEIAKKFGVESCSALKDEKERKACYAALDAAHVSDDEEKEKKEEVEIDEAKGTAYPATVDTLRKIVKDKQHQTVMFKSGKAIVDLFTASAMVQVYDALKPALKKTFEKMITDKGGFMKTQAFAMKMIG